MHIGVVTLRLEIDSADSLKDKRQVVRSLLQHLRNKFNVSASEVDDLGLWRRATVGVAIVTNDARFANQVLSQAVNHVESDPRVALEDYALEILPFVPSGDPEEGMQAIGDEPDDREQTEFRQWFLTPPTD
ncbi:MAG: DUF503 domain-containing protein [Capsulimonadales bacterium]|nr:DUF503 domain-containing protein [Capsulimonadales bacterium]